MRIQKKGKEPTEDEVVPKMYTEGAEVLAQPFLTRSSGLKGQVQGLCMRPPHAAASEQVKPHSAPRKRKEDPPPGQKHHP